MESYKIKYTIQERECWYYVESSIGHICICCTENMAKTIVEALENLCETKEITVMEFHRNFR